MEFLRPIGKHFKCYKNFDENIKILRENLEKLNNQKIHIKSRLDTKPHPGRKPKQEVEIWLQNIERINNEAQAIEEKVRGRRYLSYTQLGKNINEMIEEVKKISQQVDFIEGLVVDAPTSSKVKLPTTTIEKYTNEIWTYLMGNEVRKIGVCGMKGAGKTTIMKHIKSKLSQELTNKFDNVIWVTVSSKLGVIELQNEIAHAMDQDLSKYEDKIVRAQQLLKMLEEKNRYVLILDNLWEAYSLKEVGIPEPTKSNECKIVLATRSSKVCRKMDCIVIKVGVLTKEEAWNLFLDEVGHDVLKHPNLKIILKLFIEQCVCLPLAIITIGSRMKGVLDIYEWRNTLNEFRRCIKCAKDMESKISEQFKFGYGCWCFLYCALNPKDFEIPKMELIEYWIAKGLVDGSNRKQKYDKGHDVLNELENNYLLDTTSNGSVRMRVVVRDIAMNITKVSHRFMWKVGMQLKELPNEKEWIEELEEVSLMNNSISEICSDMSPKCQKLLTLLLQRNPLKRISESFFVHMSGLKVLDISYTDIEILPNSVSNLGTLTTLLLRGCWNLKYVPSLAKLSELRTLDLRYTRITEVPHGIEMLVNLRCLNLYAEYLKMLPVEILPKLYQLQCLIVWCGSDTLKIKGEEVAGLSNLETFVGQLYNLHGFNLYVKSLQGRGPRIFHLQVGQSDLFSNRDSCIDFDEEGENLSKHVGLRNCSINKRGEDPILLPNDTECLSIEECKDVSSLCEVSSLKIDLLKYCEIRYCDGIECLLRLSSFDCTSLQSLEVLLLVGLKQLRNIFKQEGPFSPPLGTFSRLKELYISRCSNIKKLFTPQLSLHLNNLEVIDVSHCEEIEEIIAEKEEGEEQGKGERNYHSILNTITLPKLRRLYLSILPELKSIIYSKGIMASDSLEEIFVYRCPKLEWIPFSLPMHDGRLIHPRLLKRIVIDDQEWWNKLKWDDSNTKDVLQPFICNWWTG